MKLELFHAPRACSIVSLIALYEAGADFTLHPVHTKKQQQRSPEYLRLNPKAKVPVLVIDGEPLTENIAILSWIASSFPAKALLPTDPRQAAKALSVMSWCASGMHPLMPRMNAPSRISDLPAAEESIRRMATEEMGRHFAIADGLFAKREWVGDRWSIADTYLWWVWERAGAYGLDRAPYSNFAAHAKRVEQRPTVQRALSLASELEARFAQAA
jgi:glutathione S-transferase